MSPYQNIFLHLFDRFVHPADERIRVGLAFENGDRRRPDASLLKKIIAFL